MNNRVKDFLESIGAKARQEEHEPKLHALGIKIGPEDIKGGMEFTDEVIKMVDKFEKESETNPLILAVSLIEIGKHRMKKYAVETIGPHVLECDKC